MTELTLTHGLAFTDLYQTNGLGRIDDLFQAHLAAADADLAGRLGTARAQPAAHDAKAESALLIAVAPHLEDFIAGMFQIRAEVGALAGRPPPLAALSALQPPFARRPAPR